MVAPAVVRAAVLLSLSSVGSATGGIVRVHLVAEFGGGGTGPQVDVNGDGVDDLGFFRLEGWPSTHFCRHIVYGVNGTVVTGHFGAGTHIGASSTFVDAFTASGSEHMHQQPGDGPVIWAQWYPGSPTDTTPVFFGFRITTAGGAQHYGWGVYALHSIRPDLIHNATALGFAYESTPSTGLAAGAEGNNCGTADFDGDGDFGTDQDIEAFFRCLAGSCCAECWSYGADFNGDGDPGTDQDIEAYFRVLAGASC